MTLEEVIADKIRDCGIGRHADLAEPIANAVRAFLGSEEVVESARQAIVPLVSEDMAEPFLSAWTTDLARAALSSIGGE